MRPKRQLNKRIKGWFPQEPASSLSGDEKVTVKTNPISIGVVSARAMGGLGLGCFLSGFALLSVPYLLFPSSYTPKANSAWGYSEPATVEAWIVLGVAIGLIFLSVFAFALFGVKLKSQGSKWMKYTYWITPGHDGYCGKTLFKVTVAANIALVGAFVAFTVYAAVMGLIELRFQSMVIFSVLLALVNLFLHEYSKKKSHKSKGEIRKMNAKRSLQNHVRGWLPKETTLSATMTVQMAIMFEREKAYRRKVASVLLGISGVLFGLAAAGYAYFCFSKIGVTAFDASIYAVIMCIFVLGIFWLVAFNLKRILQIFAKELKA